MQDEDIAASGIPLTRARLAANVPRAIFFDVGDTLLRPRYSLDHYLTMIGTALGIELPLPVVDGLARRVDERVAERTRQGQPFTFPAEVSQHFWYETYHDHFLNHLPGDQAARLAQALLAELSSPSGYLLFDDTLRVLEELRREGYHLGIISNWEAWLPALLEASGIDRYVDTIIVSGICRIEKPDPRVFSLALDQTGFAPDEVTYIGDRPAHDVIPALQASITPILLDRDNRYPEHAGCPRIRSLEQLPAVLERWASYAPASKVIQGRAPGPTLALPGRLGLNRPPGPTQRRRHGPP